MNTLSLKIAGITCPACIKLIKRNIAEIDPGATAEIDLAGNAKIISERPIALDQVQQILKNSDFNII